jgi:hypothetical protein
MAQNSWLQPVLGPYGSQGVQSKNNESKYNDDDSAPRRGPPRDPDLAPRKLKKATPDFMEVVEPGPASGLPSFYRNYKGLRPLVGVEGADPLEPLVCWVDLPRADIDTAIRSGFAGLLPQQGEVVKLFHPQRDVVINSRYELEIVRCTEWVVAEVVAVQPSKIIFTAEKIRLAYRGQY